MGYSVRQDRLLLVIAMAHFLSLQLLQVIVQSIESFVPDTAVGLQPSIKLREWIGPQIVNPSISYCMNPNESGITKHAEMLGCLWLVMAKSIGNFPH
ncbi:MAG: hypothetical protein K0S39_1282 [Paenibacillus sp.]|jgi:hypothetical protein|nr:hypothetical protein [Paenibacillus sp.]